MSPPRNLPEKAPPIQQNVTNYTSAPVVIIIVNPPSVAPTPEKEKPQSSASKTRVFLAILASITALGVAYFQYVIGKSPDTPSTPTHSVESHMIAGRVIDEKNNPLARAEITITGRSERCVTEDNGNFTISLNSLPAGRQVRLSISKKGYISSDQSVSPPNENMTIVLSRLR